MEDYNFSLVCFLEKQALNAPFGIRSKPGIVLKKAFWYKAPCHPAVLGVTCLSLDVK